MGSKRPFGWLLNRFWEVSDLFWTLSGAFGRFFWPSKPNFYKALVQHGLQEAFCFLSFLDQFWQGLGKIWMRLGRSGAFTIETFASHGHFLNTLGVPCCLTLCYRNPRVASLRLAERHNTRGFRPQTRVKLTLTSGFSAIELT